jgi:hypothetical protein
MGTVHLVLHLNGYQLPRVALINRCPLEGRYTLYVYKDFGEKEAERKRSQIRKLATLFFIR